MNWRRLPLLGLIWPPTAAEHAEKRRAEAEQLAEYHRQQAIEASDSAAWALAQQQHHEVMAAMYRNRLARAVALQAIEESGRRHA